MSIFSEMKIPLMTLLMNCVVNTVNMDAGVKNTLLLPLLSSPNVPQRGDVEGSNAESFTTI